VTVREAKIPVAQDLRSPDPDEIVLLYQGKAMLERAVIASRGIPADGLIMVRLPDSGQ
jgi:hypothetical protein